MTRFEAVELVIAATNSEHPKQAVKNLSDEIWENLPARIDMPLAGFESGSGSLEDLKDALERSRSNMIASGKGL